MMLIPMRLKRSSVRIGSVAIGGDHPILVQSMTNTKTSDADATVAQIHRLEAAGCELVRVSVPDKASADALPDIIRRIHIPIAADIHFDYRLALAAIAAGVDKLRINPGNIGSRERVAEVVKAAKGRGVPIRIGVNAGSLEKNLLEKYEGATPDALAESAMNHVRILEELDFTDIVISVKGSDVALTVAAYERLAELCAYPLHIGVTEAGTVYGGSIRSAVGIGIMLHKGIGDTIRVSLTGDPVEEIRCAKEILEALKLRRFGFNLISCPTCARTNIDIQWIADRLLAMRDRIPPYLTIAVMGCVVNGPGEARDADFGITGGNGEGLIFKKGEIVKKVPEEQLMGALLELIGIQ